MKTFKIGDKVKVAHKPGAVVEGTIQGDRQWIQISGQSATKHCPASSAVMGWGYKVRAPIMQADGTPYTDRNNRPLMGISYVDEKLISEI